jgi:uncharacterized protein YjbJ (UPF0337 family)
MNWDQVQTNWTQAKSKLHDQWEKLTEQDLDWIDGQKDRLLSALKDRYGMEVEKAKAEVERWVSTIEDRLRKTEHR